MPRGLQLVEENYAGVLCTKLWFPFEIRFTFPISSAFPNCESENVYNLLFHCDSRVYFLSF